MARDDLRKKHDKELIEFLNELRVALPGAQVLFAFLLVAPFSAKFDLDELEKAAYLVALLSTLLGTVLLIAPSAYHRLRWREKNKERMLRIGNMLAIAGLAAMTVVWGWTPVAFTWYIFIGASITVVVAFLTHAVGQPRAARK